MKHEKTNDSLPDAGSTCRWRHWAQISFIMHCIGELIDPIAFASGRRRQASDARRAVVTAAIIRSEPIVISRSTSGKGMSTGPSLPAAYASIACTMLPVNVRSRGRRGSITGPASTLHTTWSHDFSISPRLKRSAEFRKAAK